jgi:hypothetical protein
MSGFHVLALIDCNVFSVVKEQSSHDVLDD